MGACSGTIWSWVPTVAVLPVLPADAPVLHRPAERVRSFDASLRKLAADMVETMHGVNGVGLAAPQVGVSLRLAVIQLPEDYANRLAGRLFVLCNPVIERAWGDFRPAEGCLSLPGYIGYVRRARIVLVRAQNLDGKTYRLPGRGTMAQALQHEIDHLDGILFYDHLASIDELVPAPPGENGREQI